MFHWVNRFNRIEHGDPCATVQDAKNAAVETYSVIQGGFAFDLAIVSTEGDVISHGYMKSGKWIDGDFSETPEESKRRLGL